MAVLDATFLIDVRDGDADSLRLLEVLRTEHAPLRVPAAAWLEFLAGFPPAGRARAVAILEADVQFEPFTRELADEAARLQFELVSAGRGLAWHDLQIAATALHYNEPLITCDRSFATVPGVDLRAH
ncbi:MAG: PIN domain-containing protein [bacterium]